MLDHAREKLARKGCDLLVVNEVGTDTTFGHDDSTVHLLRPGSDDATQVGPASKLVVAHAVWDACCRCSEPAAPRRSAGRE